MALTNKEEEAAARHRLINTGIAGSGAVIAGVGARAALKGKKKLMESADKLTGEALKTNKDMRDAIKAFPLNRSNSAKDFRKRQKLKRFAKQKKKWSKARKILNKLPGGRIKIFDNPIIARTEQMKKAKHIAQGMIMLDEDPVRVAKDIRRINRKVASNVKTGRKGVEAVRDIQDMVKGERRNKRRKRFYEKQHFKDQAMAAAITAGLGGAAYLAGSKRGRQLLKQYEENKGEVTEFAHAGWHTSRPTTGSVRVHHVGYKRRKRRGKYWHERKKNRDKALAATTGLAGAATIYGLLSRRKTGKILKKLKVSEKRRRMLGGKVKAVKDQIKPHMNSPKPTGQGKKILDAMDKVDKDYNISRRTKNKKAK